MDNFFTSPKLLVDLLAFGSFGTNTLRFNCISLPSDLKDKKVWKKEDEGTISWCMHCTGELCCIVWVDKKLMLLLSIHKEPLSLDLEQMLMMLRSFNGVEIDVPTSAVHLEYTTTCAA